MSGLRAPLVVAGLALAAMGALGTPAAQAQELLLRVGDTAVPEGTIVYGDAIAVGGTLDVAGTVTGDALAAGGSVHVGGHVGGNVRAIGGDVILDSTAVVGGTARSMGGTVRAAPGAVVRRGGATPNPVPYSGPAPWPPQFPSPGPSPFPGTRGWLPPAVLGMLAMWKLLAGALIALSLLTFIGTAWLTALMFPGATAAVAGVLERSPGAAGIAGIVVWLLLGPIAVLLVASIAGIMLVLLLIAAVLIAIQLGITAVAALVGHRVRQGRIAIEALVGAVLLAVAFAVPGLGWLAAFAATTWGTGAVVMTIVERRRGQGALPPAVPAAPPSSTPPVSPPPPPPSV